MLTASQIKWAASHDWFVRDNGDGTIEVEDRSVDRQGVYSTFRTWSGTFGQLRDWAGY